MHALKKILDFYIFSNIHVALSGFCLTKITLIQVGIHSNLTPFFVAFSIIISYNFIRFFELKYKRLQWYKKWFFNHQKILLFLVLVSIFLLGFILVNSSFNLQSLSILFPFAFMTLFYVVPLFKMKKVEVSFRNFPFVKIISIAISWAGITVLFPLYETGVKFTSIVYIEFFQRFLFLIAILIPFDIRDVMIDPKSLKTLPQILGVDKSKLVGYLMLVSLIFLEFFKTENSIYFTYILIVVSLITALFLMFSSTKRTRYYTSFWVEAIPIIWFCLIVLFL
jgi:hypothetical protein